MSRYSINALDQEVTYGALMIIFGQLRTSSDEFSNLLGIFDLTHQQSNICIRNLDPLGEYCPVEKAKLSQVGLVC
ncbi:MAG: hypothetical protein AAGD96_04420 [Chloroflexota bacterium]